MTGGYVISQMTGELADILKIMVMRMTNLTTNVTKLTETRNSLVTVINPRASPIWLKEFIEQYVEQLRVWNQDNTAGSAVTKFGYIMELLKQKDSYDQ